MIRSHSSLQRYGLMVKATHFFPYNMLTPPAKATTATQCNPRYKLGLRIFAALVKPGLNLTSPAASAKLGMLDQF